MQCWGCGNNHKFYGFPHMKDQPQRIHKIKEYVIMEDMSRATRIIYASLDDHQAEHQAIVVEVGGENLV